MEASKMSSSFFTPIEDAVLSKVGSMRQVAGIRRSTLDDGRERGIRIAEFRNGGGLAFTVLLDRGMDIAEASFGGVSLAFLGPLPPGHPSYYDPNGIGWLRNWGAGLMSGCGLRSVGSPSEFEGEAIGLHGRLSNTPAESIKCEEEWVNSKYLLSVSGTMRDGRLFGENLMLKRSISTAFGINEIHIKDTVRNCGFRPSPAMLLYHINLGWPLLDESLTLEAEPHEVKPRTENAKAAVESWMKAEPPVDGFIEQCLYHDIPAGKDGMASISAINHSLRLKLTISYRKAELPFLTQWRNFSKGEYVMGLEPSNCHVEGVAEERDKFKTLKMLAPGESFETSLILSVARI
jgi:hypothetical protein